MEISRNKAVWDGKYHWADRGDEWSAPWGGVAAQWYGSLLPRLLPFVPVDRMVEIACGQGRITQFLKDLTGEYVGIDLSEQCVAVCRTNPTWVSASAGYTRYPQKPNSATRRATSHSQLRAGLF